MHIDILVPVGGALDRSVGRFLVSALRAAGGVDRVEGALRVIPLAVASGQGIQVPLGELGEIGIGATIAGLPYLDVPDKLLVKLVVAAALRGHVGSKGPGDVGMFRYVLRLAGGAKVSIPVGRESIGLRAA